MGQINVTPAVCMIDAHLLREYRAIPGFFARQRNSMVRASIAPSNFTNGRHNGRFFADKVAFVRYRYGELFSELRNRGYHVNKSHFESVLYSAANIAADKQGQYKPTPEDIYNNMHYLTGLTIGLSTMVA